MLSRLHGAKILLDASTFCLRNTFYANTAQSYTSSSHSQHYYFNYLCPILGVHITGWSRICLQLRRGRRIRIRRSLWRWRLGRWRPKYLLSIRWRLSWAYLHSARSGIRRLWSISIGRVHTPWADFELHLLLGRLSQHLVSKQC